MRNIKLTIEYDGTRYHGWQSQINALAVQDVVTRAIEEVTGEKCSLTGASRTDVGVHAFGQAANFRTESPIPADKFPFALNCVLPDDITIQKSEEVGEEFHSRFSTTGKKYRYLFYNAVQPSALLRHRAYHVYRPMDLEAMRTAAQALVGMHDFAAFRATGSDVKTSVRTIYGIELSRNGNIVEMEISGDGFLYNMVRIIAGTLAEIGVGKKSAEEMEGILTGLDRRKAGKTAPAHGLYLVEVYY